MTTDEALTRLRVMHEKWLAEAKTLERRYGARISSGASHVTYARTRARSGHYLITSMFANGYVDLVTVHRSGCNRAEAATFHAQQRAAHVRDAGESFTAAIREAFK